MSNTYIYGIDDDTGLPVRVKVKGGKLQVATSLEVSTLEIGTVDQGAAGVTPWPVVDTALATEVGATNEAAPASDAAAAGLNGRLQRIAQRLSSLIGQIPATLGQKAKTASLAVTLASDEDLLTNIGGLTETAPASDTASSGINGRLQRIAQRLSSLIGLLPSTIGQKAKTTSLAVTLASDDDLLTKIGEVQASPTANTVLDRLKALLTGIIVAAGENHIGEVGGRSTVVAVTLTRPGDTNAYIANDAVTDSTSAPQAIDFAGMVRSAGKSGLLTTWQMTRNSTVAATFRLWLYQDTITPANDNAAFSIAAAATDKRVGYVDFTTSIAGSDCIDYYGTPVFTNWPVKPVSGTGLKGVLQALTGFVPIANETFKFKVGALQD